MNRKRLDPELQDLLTRLAALGGEAQRDSYSEVSVWGPDTPAVRALAEELAEWLGLSLEFTAEG